MNWLPGFDLLWTLLAIGAAGIVTLAMALARTASKPYPTHRAAPSLAPGQDAWHADLAWRREPGTPFAGGWVSGQCWDGPREERWPGHDDPLGRPPVPPGDGPRSPTPGDEPPAPSLPWEPGAAPRWPPVPRLAAGFDTELAADVARMARDGHDGATAYLDGPVTS